MDPSGEEEEGRIVLDVWVMVNCEWMEGVSCASGA